mmetsp:Transcript_23033/g.50505  ORF Transcript_23033/g.50505 Transcript_23033/m.50505 type:complete len:205 (-) Transcript_23033:224-838(-)
MLLKLGRGVGRAPDVAVAEVDLGVYLVVLIGGGEDLVGIGGRPLGLRRLLCLLRLLFLGGLLLCWLSHVRLCLRAKERQLSLLQLVLCKLHVAERILLADISQQQTNVQAVALFEELIPLRLDHCGNRLLDLLRGRLLANASGGLKSINIHRLTAELAKVVESAENHRVGLQLAVDNVFQQERSVGERVSRELGGCKVNQLARC